MVSPSKTSQSNEILICNDSQCMDDKDKDSLECGKCHRKVHYRCTKLPAYHIQTILNVRVRFYCQNCVNIPEKLLQLVPKRQSSIPSIKVQKEMERLKQEVAQYQYLNNEYKENRLDLLNTIKEQKAQLKDLKKNLRNDPAFHTLEYIESAISRRLEDVEGKILEAVKKECAETTTTINSIMEKSYAAAVRSTTTDVQEGNQKLNNVNKQEEPTKEVASLKEVIKAARNAEKAEESDRKKRSRNIIIYGVKEHAIDKTSKEDEEFASNLVKVLHTKATIKRVSRIGSTEKGKIRPVIISLQNEEQKIKLLGNLPALKGMDLYKSISVTEDLTLEERKQYKDLANTAKERNKADPISTHIWRVRGSSKNGFVLKKMPKGINKQ